MRGVDLIVSAGEVVCLLGANGAGKSTTLLTIAGVLPPLGGTVTVLGVPVTGGRAHEVAQRGLAIVPEGRGLFYRLTSAENLRLRRHRKSTVTVDDVLDTSPPSASCSTAAPGSCRAASSRCSRLPAH